MNLWQTIHNVNAVHVSQVREEKRNGPNSESYYVQDVSVVDDSGNKVTITMFSGNEGALLKSNEKQKEKVQG